MSDEPIKHGEHKIAIGSYLGTDLGKAYKPPVALRPQTLNPPSGGSNVTLPPQGSQQTASKPAAKLPTQNPPTGNSSSNKS